MLPELDPTQKRDPITRAQIDKYIKVKDALDEIKEAEMIMRKAICQRVLHLCLETGEAKSSDKKFIYTCEDGTQLTFKPGVNATVDQEGIKTDWPKMTQPEKDCFKIKYDMSAAKFNKLRAEVENKDYVGKKDLLIFDNITEKPGAPTLEIVIE